MIVMIRSAVIRSRAKLALMLIVQQQWLLTLLFTKTKLLFQTSVARQVLLTAAAIAQRFA